MNPGINEDMLRQLVGQVGGPYQVPPELRAYVANQLEQLAPYRSRLQTPTLDLLTAPRGRRIEDRRASPPGSSSDDLANYTAAMRRRRQTREKYESRYPGSKVVFYEDGTAMVTYPDGSRVRLDEYGREERTNTR